MDLTGGAGQKVLSFFRAAPRWLLLALFLSALILWLIPKDALPVELVPWLPTVTVVLGVAVVCRFAADLTVYAAKQRAHALAYDRQMLIRVYRPLRMLFLTRHVIISTGVAAPRFRDRWENARYEIASHRHWRAAVKRAWRALFDRKSSTSAEMDFGGEFPLGEICELAKSCSAYADTELLELIRRADRASCECAADTNLLTDEELALFEHIIEEHERLSRRTGGQLVDS
ncbi:hypothetical protein LG047_13990 [Methylocystis sp. WRRC1]|uniref:hypothetical protein n=1 Tax=Methylocystis sp. WRRC1 TaxID=1732014 RepID=UPI001D14C3E1|nr:hypothetical protein [Methylocystis sp. WRRC1]MCC3246414.1 hypothetical protein [Methylocystis sp. WRRC1]